MESALICNNIKYVVKEYTLTLLKLSNKLEEQSRVLKKITDAEKEDPENLFIPNSLRLKFVLESSKHVQGTQEFTKRRMQVEQLVTKHNSEISNHCKATA